MIIWRLLASALGDQRQRASSRCCTPSARPRPDQADECRGHGAVGHLEYVKNLVSLYRALDAD